ncbi:XdhC family protein [Serinibacter arcticus]|uniref:Xanthine and CO dehydrogenases maturation factor, XdhC/CoxF family n=1 Tax=Serinibacter arcticus TaxID=1655435 RepID=A0A4Z1E3M5_9MICO|nr:XdhC/CoxI family protein [Serinibacter arcticus]TGO05538.1 Xanthine and CO dehydrogenases maturation factor, XdhC/CoxF family [Serinibacter arcticus]
MFEHAAHLLPLLRGGDAVALVTITRVRGSAPRVVGATMAVTAQAQVLGSLSGGCAESDAVLLALDALRTGEASSATFALACGGSIDVVAHRVLPTDTVAVAALADATAGRAAAVGLIRSGPGTGTIVVPGCDDGAGAPGADGVDSGEARLLVLRHEPRPPLLIVGAGEHAVALCRVAAAVGFAVTVCDDSGLLATAERFPDAAAVLVADPAEHLASLAPHGVDPRTAICVLTHDERVDVPVLLVALALPVAFVGAMGSRATVARRRRLLHEGGLRADRIARLRSPLGLDLGGSSPGETALAILAEVVAARHGASARPLNELTGRVHRPVTTTATAVSPAVAAGAVA